MIKFFVVNAGCIRRQKSVGSKYVGVVWRSVVYCLIADEMKMKMKVISILGLIQMTWAQLFLENFRFSCLLPHQHCHRGRHQNGKYMFFGEGVHVGRPGKASSFLMRAGTWIWHSGQRFGIWSLDEM